MSEGVFDTASLSETCVRCGGGRKNILCGHNRGGGASVAFTALHSNGQKCISTLNSRDLTDVERMCLSLFESQTTATQVAPWGVITYRWNPTEG